MLDSYSNPIIALHRYHPHIHIPIRNFPVSERTGKPRYRCAWNRFPGYRVGDVVIALSIFTYSHWAWEGEGEDTDVFGVLTHSPNKQTPHSPRLRPCFSLLFLSCGCPSFAMTWLDSALKISFENKEGTQCISVQKTSRQQRCQPQPLKKTPLQLPTRPAPPSSLLPQLFGILIRDQLTRLSTVSCSAPHQKLLVCVKRRNLHVWYVPICQGVTSHVCHPPGCSFPPACRCSS